MDGFLIYANVILTFALGVLAAAGAARLTAASVAIDALRRDLPTDARIRDRALHVAHDELPRLLERAMGTPDFRRQVALIVQLEISRGTLAGFVKQSVEDQCRQLARYIEDEAIPRAIGAAVQPSGVAA